LNIGKPILSLSPKILKLLKTVPLFTGLSSEILNQYLEHANRISLTPGKALLAPGDANENIYVILSGRLRIHTDYINAAPVAMFGEGESVGEMSILNSNKALDYVIADTDCELLCIPLVTIWSLLNGSHHAALNMLNILSTPSSMSKRSNPNVEQEHGYESLNHVDELTGLYNSQWIFQIFDRQIRRLAFTEGHSVLMMVSIDQFEHYNQQHGRLGGDQAFRTVAQTVLTCLRPDDHSGRHHGNALAIFMSNTRLDEGQVAAKRLLLQASDAGVVTPSGDILPHVTISIGIAEVQKGNTIQQLFEHAEQALKRAMADGGNCIRN
jgi:diguanylate cyclase (GGDEF)-like protein